MHDRFVRTATVISFCALILSLPSASPAQTLPSPWSSQDIGTPALAGSASATSGTFTVRAAGSDIWGTSDQFHFVYQTLSADGEIVARVDSITQAHQWSKAGVMMRETLTATSKHAYALASAGKGNAFQRRLSTRGSSTHTAGTYTTPPRWVRLVRTGNTFRSYESSNGTTWQAIGSSSITMASTIYVGLAVTSHNTNARTTATISQVRIVTAGANQPPTVSLTSPANGASFTAPANITLQASASDPDGTIGRVEFFRGSTLIGSATAAPYSFNWTNVAAGTYTLTAVAIDNAGARTTSAAASVTVTDTTGSVPSPWTAEDVGSPAVAGSASYASGLFTVEGAGADIWDTADQFQFVHQLMTGDGEIVARVRSVTAVHAWSKSGVMIRENLTAGSKHATSLVSASNGVAYQRRPTSGGTSLHTAGAAVRAPYWVRMVRRGDVFEAYQSADGSAWSLIGSQTIAMPQTVYVGLAVTSHNTTTATTATFSDVTVSEGGSTNQPPTISVTSPGSGATFTAPASVTIAATASDPNGSVTRVDFYQGSTLISSDTTSPYSASWTNVAAGSYTITAVATDDAGETTTSAGVSITVNSSTNQLPTVSLTSPVSGAVFSAPTTVALTATAADTDGTVARVEFYAGTALIGSDTTSPYGANWSNGAPGTYSLTAVAVDNAGGRRTSVAATVTLNPTRAVFNASTDHNTSVTSYRLEIFVAGANPSTATPVATRDLGKPTPSSSNEITVDITSTLQPLAAGTYFATVSAVSSGGSARSAPSANFSR